MHGHDHLWHGRHADDVGPDQTQEAVLGPRLQVGAGYGDVDAPMHGEILAPADLQGPLDELPFVGAAHVGEAGPEPVVVDADERVASHQVNVIVDHHDVAAGVVGVHPTAGV